MGGGIRTMTYLLLCTENKDVCVVVQFQASTSGSPLFTGCFAAGSHDAAPPGVDRLSELGPVRPG